MLDFLGELKARKGKHGPTKGRPLPGAQVANHMIGIEGLYRFMHDEREQAAAALGDRRWLRLGPEHTRFWRHGEKPARHHPLDERHLLPDAAFAQIIAGLHVLGDPVSEDGLGDEQAMRALMLLARTGRRLNEILLLDFDPLIAIDGLPPDADAGQAVAAKLRYQQTKIDDAPDTILVDEEIVAIIRAQQHWVRDRIPTTDDDAPTVHPPDREPLRHTPLHRRRLPAAHQPARPPARSARRPRPPDRLSPHPSLPPHPRHQPAQRRGPAARRPALPRAPLAEDDDALRPDAGRHPRA
jgi:hypothetical protein